MLDTVGIKHYLRVLQSEDFKETWRFMSKYQKPTWIYNEKSEKTLPNLTMTLTPEGIYHLSAQVSLPKFLFGHNARLPTQDEVNHGLQLVAEYTEEKSRQAFDAQTAIVSLVHFAYDVNLTEPGVWNAIEYLSKKKLKPLKKNFYEDATLYFKNIGKTKLIRIYPKFQAVLSEKKPTAESISYAKGNLRFESCFLEKPAIDSLVKKYGLPNSQAQNLLMEKVSDLVISELLENLNFFESLTNEKSTLQILLEHFPAKRAQNLHGFLQMVKEHGEGFYKDESLKFSKSSYSRNVRDCRKAKVW